MTCPRCGRAQPPAGSAGTPTPGAARYCVHCGRVLTGVRWVASPPDAFRPRPRGPRPRRYTGPPRYPAVPRWSLWPWPAPASRASGSGPATPPADVVLRTRAGLLRRLAVTTAVLAVLAALAEGWRYGLLVASRDGALSAAALAWSDAVVTLVGLLAPAAAVATAVVGLRWLLHARGLAAEQSGTRPARSPAAVVVGSLIPPLSLVVPGAVLAETEHAASGLPSGLRPRPSRTVARWWAAWAAGVVLGLVTVVHGLLAASTQALADGVVLHGVVDLVAAVTALLTVRVVEHLTELLAPELRGRGRSWVVRLGDADRVAATATATAADGPAPARV